MSEAMELTNEALETIGGYVKRNLSIWMKEVVPPTYVQLDPQAIERMVRMEESLSSQRDLLNRSLEQIDRHFTEHREEFAARFKQIDKRFDQQREDFAERFKQIDKRFDEQREDFAERFKQIDKRFEQQREDFAARFDQQRDDFAVRFEQQREDFAARFKQNDKRFDDIQRHSNRWMTVISIILGLIGVAVTVTNLM